MLIQNSNRAEGIKVAGDHLMAGRGGEWISMRERKAQKTKSGQRLTAGAGGRRDVIRRQRCGRWRSVDGP